MADRLYLDDLAALAGIKVSTLRQYRSSGSARLPDPDGIEVDRGHARPWWWESTALEWKANRPGRGWWGPRHARAARS